MRLWRLTTRPQPRRRRRFHFVVPSRAHSEPLRGCLTSADNTVTVPGDWLRNQSFKKQKSPPPSSSGLWSCGEPSYGSPQIPSPSHHRRTPFSTPRLAGGPIRPLPGRDVGKPIGIDTHSGSRTPASTRCQVNRGRRMVPRCHGASVRRGDGPSRCARGTGPYRLSRSFRPADSVIERATAILTSTVTPQ